MRKWSLIAFKNLACNHGSVREEDCDLKPYLLTAESSDVCAKPDWLRLSKEGEETGKSYRSSVMKDSLQVGFGAVHAMPTTAVIGRAVSENYRSLGWDSGDMSVTLGSMTHWNKWSMSSFSKATRWYLLSTCCGQARHWQVWWSRCDKTGIVSAFGELLVQWVRQIDVKEISIHIIDKWQAPWGKRSGLKRRFA